VTKVLARMSMDAPFTITADRVLLDGTLTQEQFAYMLHSLNFPISTNITHSRNVWGSIFVSAKALTRATNQRGVEVK